ncbi:capsular biosynthesis protein CpsI [Candidatus Endobugula sertula]|uniref:Capsular biosynthesis protein CpsI n=1 Tax=Candidatus Endobugula sertula TaxID=62101 RepID=A0A1D2QSJ9_9GAMM|nr:capsular biosynthesis protein CpsI [Candidatus Endobugula sertula]
MKVLVTGAAGFIGAHVSLSLLRRGDDVIGIDNLNDYYAVSLKQARLEWIDSTETKGKFQFHKIDISDQQPVDELFENETFDKVINLAAQAGVRYSLEAPRAYIESNIIGFNNILEACRHHQIQHLVYASSSSVYGANESIPFSVQDNVDHPVSLYAATKKSNELMAHTYSHLYGIPTTGLRFFTVYGPWGRPDMSPFLFADAIIQGKPLKVFNYGKHRRDFTYIDDIVEGVVRTLDINAAPNKQWSGTTPDPSSSKAPWKVYNIGCSNPIPLLDYITILEEVFGQTTEKELLPLQPGDVPDTYADVQQLIDDIGYQPSTSLYEGVKKFAAWYKDFYCV